MSHTASSGTTTWRSLVAIATGLLGIAVATLATFVDWPASSAAPTFRSSAEAGYAGGIGHVVGAVTAADGVLPDGVTVFDDTHPGVVNLAPALLQVLRAAATDAGDDGIVVYVNSGWRSPAYQDQLLREAVVEYGSAEEAARWVATADTSAHVSGDAVDIGSFDAVAWLAEHGAAYGLCQTYRNESWHFERRPEAVDVGCPPMYADPTHDPRLQP